MPPDDTSQPSLLSLLHHILDEHFSLEELKSLCFDLKIDNENLPGGTKEGKARELVVYLDRYGRVPELIKLGRRLRPNAPWPTLPDDQPPAPLVSFERARPFLPHHLYRQRLYNPSSDNDRLCTDHLKALLETVQTYCSEPILHEAEPEHQAMGHWLDATLLFADISGFTAMSERLNTRGRAGAEEITWIVNRYFTTMVEILHQNGGSLLKFGGDALLGMFIGSDRDTARYAARAALNMQREMIHFADISTSGERFRLDMKVGLHTGQVFAAHVGGWAQMEYWVTGRDVNLTAQAEEAAKQRQVVATQSTRQHLTAWGHLDPLPDNVSVPLPLYVLPITSEYTDLPPRTMVREFTPPFGWPALVAELEKLSPYLPTGLLPRLVHQPFRRQVEGEHRLVAVLFVNVDGFSDLAAVLPPEQSGLLTQTMQDYFATVYAVVMRHGGTINKTDLYSTGDKLLAVFGAPVAHEDDVDQAAHAAVALQGALVQINQRLAERCPTVNVRLRQRLGLSTGCVFSGNVGAAVRQEYTIMGDEVNLAARLMSEASWGEIWVSSHMYLWLSPYGDFEKLGEIRLKGKAEPVSTYRLKQMGMTYRPKPPFINRIEAQKQLRKDLAQLLQGQGCIAELVGEPGIGKSRLWEQVHSTPEAEMVLWLVGHCHEQQPAFHLWAELLRGYLGLAQNATDEQAIELEVLIRKVEVLFGAEEVNERCPFLAIVLGLPLADGWKEQVSNVGDYLSKRIAQEMQGLFIRLAKDRPLVLICEGLQWIDADSAEVLLEVMDLVGFEMPIMLGLTVSSLGKPDYERVIGRAKQFQTRFQSISLEPLAPADRTQLAQTVLGQAATPERLAHIVEHSGGNPFFIREMAQAAITFPNEPVPDTVQKLIESRVDALQEDARDTLRAASVVGMQFTSSELAYMLDRSDLFLRRQLSELRSKFLIEDKRGYYEIHPLVQEVVYLRQGFDTLRAFHLRLGDYWVDHQKLAKAADHYFVGELWPAALAQGESAANECFANCAFQGAIRLYTRATQAAARLGQNDTQARLYYQLGLAHFQIAQYEPAAHALSRAYHYLGLSGGDAMAQAEIYRALGHTYDRWGKYVEALEVLNSGLRLVGAAPTSLRAQLLLVRCSVLINTGALHDAERDGQEALQIAQTLVSLKDEASACNNLGSVYGTLQQFERALEYHERALAIRRQIGTQCDVGQSLNNVATALSPLERFAEAEDHYREALDIHVHIGDRYNEAITHHSLAWLYRDQKQKDKAEEEYKRALEISERVGHRRGIAFAHNDLGTLCLEQNRLDEAVQHLEKSAQIYEEMGAGTYLPDNYRELADAYRKSGRLDDAAKAEQKATEWDMKNRS